MEQVSINWVPNIESYINLEEFYYANESIYGVRDNNDFDESFDYQLRSVIVRHGRNVNNSHYTSIHLIY